MLTPQIVPQSTSYCEGRSLFETKPTPQFNLREEGEVPAPPSPNEIGNDPAHSYQVTRRLVTLIRDEKMRCL